mmetsp:Transcript_106075/g.306839  ORF Transcript_106075/g.306839 Transcript_106075/m.306839 type:complete len:254 (-) Transcript_106075:175-936(-)
MCTTCNAWPSSMKRPSHEAIFCDASRMALASCSGGGEGEPPSRDFAKSSNPEAEQASITMGVGPSAASECDDAAPSLGCGELAPSAASASRVGEAAIAGLSASGAEAGVVSAGGSSCFCSATSGRGASTAVSLLGSSGGESGMLASAATSSCRGLFTSRASMSACAGPALSAASGARASAAVAGRGGTSAGFPTPTTVGAVFGRSVVLGPPIFFATAMASPSWTPAAERTWSAFSRRPLCTRRRSMPRSSRCE